MNLDDAATAAVGSPTVATPHPTGPASNGGGMSIDDAAGLAVQQANAGTAATIKNNLYNAAAQSPDAAAANQSLARAANVPVETVAANPTPIKQQLAAQNTDATALIQTAPATAQFLANPNNAAIAHDDIPNLTAIEQGLASSPFDHYVQRAGRDLITAGSFMNPYTAISQVAFDIPNHLGGAGMQTLMQKYPGMIDELAKILPDNPAVANFFANNPTSPTVGGLFNKLGEAMFPGGAAETKGGQLFDAGASMAGAGSLMNAGTIAGKVWNTMTAATAGVAGAEIQPKAEAWAKENFPTNPFMQELISQAAGLASMIGTAAAGHAFTGAVDNAAQSHLAGTTKAAQADAVADHMTQINDLAAQSKVRQRDPQAFSDFVANATENAPIKDVYIDAKQFAQVAGEQLPQLAQALPDVAEQLPVALSTGGDIRIPVSDFASKLAGSDIAAQLIPHLKTDPEGFSQVEAQEHMATMGDQIQSDVSSRLAAAPENAAKQAGVDAVQQKVMDQLTQANRFTSDVNQPYAQLVANFYKSMSDRAGMTPEELYEQHPLNIQNVNAGGFMQPEGWEVADTSTGEKQRVIPKGTYNPPSSTISLMKGADLSTFLHESGHFFLDKMTNIATSDNAPGDVKADTQTLMDWLGVKDAETFKNKSIDQQRVAHEQFARTFEKYLLDGKAPSLEMQPIFSRFRSWLLSIYQSAQNFLGLHPEAGGISDEVRSVFDRMLATDSDIQKAQTARGMTPMFKTPEEAGMNEEEFKQYQDAHQSAVETAQSELDSRRLRDMQYASNARSESIKALQREAASKRAAIREEVTKEVQKEPVYAAEQYLKTGEDFDGTHSLGPVKLSAGGLKDIGVPDEMIAAMKRQKLAADEGIHPDAIANAFGFNSGQGLVEALANAEPIGERIRGMTDQRMLERHGDLTDPASIARAADAAIHNDVRAKIITTELNALNKQLGNKSLLTRAAKQFAEKIVAELPANKINPNQYIAAAAKAAKLADKAFQAGDLKEAAEQKKNQLVNQYAVKAAFEQKALVDKGLTFLNKFGNKAFREKVAGPYLEQIDGILAKYDLRKNPSDRPTRAETNLATWVKSQRDAGFEPYVPDFILNGDPQHYGDMSVEKFKGLVDTVRSMKHMSDNLNEVTIAGQKMALDYAVKELLKPMQDRGDKFTKEELLNPKQFKTDPFLQTALEKMGSTLRLIDSDLKPVEFKRNEYDLHDLQGPFGKYIFEPMFERNYWKVEQLRNISREFGAAGDRLGKDWQDSLYNLVENKTLLDPDLTTRDKNGTVVEPSYLKMTRAKMLGIARHVGNESNFDKLTKGYNWNPVDVWKFLHDNMTEKDWQATQAHWDVFEKYWPEIEALMRRLGGVPPDKIPLRPFDTKFGKMKGGYAPIDYDPIRSKLSNKWGDVMSNPDEAIGQEQAYRATTTMNGSTQNRSAGYTDIVNLDYHSAEGRLRDTIHDLAYRETLIDSNKILNHPEFRSQFLKTFGREDYKGMQGWLRGIRDMNRDESQIRGFEKWLQYARSGVVMTGIAYRLSTVLKHGSSAALKSLGYLGDSTGAKYFAARAVRMGTGNATADIQGAVAKFPEIASRMNQMDRDYKVGTRSMYQAEDWRAKNDRFGHAMVAWSDMLTAVPTAWAAYDRATVEGIPESHGGTGKPMTEKQAVAYANKIVREAHGTALEANRSLFLQARGVKGLFGTIYGFMNNTYGQMGDLMDKTVVGGHFQNKPVLLARAMATIVAPAMIAGWINGQFDDKNHFWKNVGMSLTGEVAGTVPFVRDAWSMIERQDTTGDSTAPVRVIGDTVKVGIDAFKAAEGKSSKWVQDISNALGELTHTGGLGQAGKTLQYLKDVHDGKQSPHNAKDFVTGATIGPPPQKK